MESTAKLANNTSFLKEFLDDSETSFEFEFGTEVQVMYRPGQQQQQQVPRGTVLFDYAAQASNQLSLRRGQVIGVITFGGKGEWSNGVILETGTTHAC